MHHNLQQGYRILLSTVVPLLCGNPRGIGKLAAGEGEALCRHFKSDFCVAIYTVRGSEGSSKPPFFLFSFFLGGGGILFFY